VACSEATWRVSPQASAQRLGGEGSRSAAFCPH